MRILMSILGIAAIMAPLALAQPATDFTLLRKQLNDWAIEGTIQSHAAEGIVAKGAAAAHEFAVDPNRDTIIVALCDAALCTDVNVVGSDSTGAFVTPDRTRGSEGIVTLFADSIKSKKLKVEVSAPGCRTHLAPTHCRSPRGLALILQSSWNAGPSGSLRIRGPLAMPTLQIADICHLSDRCGILDELFGSLIRGHYNVRGCALHEFIRASQTSQAI